MARIHSTDEGDIYYKLVKPSIDHFVGSHDHPTYDGVILDVIREVIRNQKETGTWEYTWRDATDNAAKVQHHAHQFNDNAALGCMETLRAYFLVHDKWAGINFDLVNESYKDRVMDALEKAWTFVDHGMMRKNNYVACPPCVTHGQGLSTVGREYEPEGVYDMAATCNMVMAADEVRKDPLVSDLVQKRASYVYAVMKDYVIAVKDHFAASGRSIPVKTDLRDWTGSPVELLPKINLTDTLPRYMIIRDNPMTELAAYYPVGNTRWWNPDKNGGKGGGIHGTGGWGNNIN